jgi:predicted GNAT family acetyltransferase
MRAQNGSHPFEYPDTAGYPDGAGFLDEGTAADGMLDGVRDIDLPSTDAQFDATVRRDETARAYRAIVGGREVASIPYDEVEDRVVVLSTIVAPEFRERGIAGELIAYALDDIRGRGMHVTSYCPVVSDFIANNSQFADVIDPRYPGR